MPIIFNSRIWKINIVKVYIYILLQEIYRCNLILIKILIIFFAEIEKNILKLI